ncbi:MAG: hypothetical protein ACI8P9_005168 [Parasphingorhabdus sp.]|jgi:hypothetical protein
MNFYTASCDKTEESNHGLWMIYICRKVAARSGHQCREFGHEFQGFEDDVGGAVSVRYLELVTNITT